MNTPKKTKHRLKLKLLIGTPRRLLWSLCRSAYVKTSLAQRRGACRRCGACCRLVWHCRYFYTDNGLPSCRRYHRYRFPNCTNFPIDRRDLADRDLVAPHTPCGYWWRHEEKAVNPARVKP